jgi:hypothetical protein
MRPSALLLLSFGVLSCTAGGCGSGSVRGTADVKVSGRAKMLDQTAIAQKCDEAAKGHERPFIVEWDATDLASFEAKASSDTVFVRYTGCKIEVVDRCSDKTIPGRFGTYGPPKWTSGTVQGFDIETEGELYAKLPLGAASLSGKIAAGESLHLKYFVSGVALDSRDALSRADLAAVPGCKEATHFVSSYNLGAFELESSSHVDGEAEASGVGMSAGGKGKRRESQVGHGGDLKSCTSSTLTACRVPIRLVLRKIDDADAPTVATGPTPPAGPAIGAPPPGSVPTAAELQEKALVQEQAQKAYTSALDKLQHGDGEGCLKDFDRAVKLNPAVIDTFGAKLSHARCLMRAGKCEAGGTEYRAALVEQDSKKLKPDDELDKETRNAANRECPSSTAKNDADFVERASREMFSLTYDAEQQKAKPVDAKTCKAKYDALYAKIAKLDKKNPEESRARQTGIGALDRGADCVAAAGKCSDGEPLYVEAYKLKLPNFTGVEKTAKDSWATRVKFKDKDKFLKGCKQ